MFKLNISLGILWNLFVTTVDGPPDKIMPFTFLDISKIYLRRSGTLYIKAMNRLVLGHVGFDPLASQVAFAFVFTR